jgi:hypothetical protein
MRRKDTKKRWRGSKYDTLRVLGGGWWSTIKLSKLLGHIFVITST